MDFLEQQQWRYATKKFDSSRKIGDRELEIIFEAIRLSVSSYGLQQYKVLVIENSQIREQLKAASWDQPQITDASHLIIFCNLTKVTSADVDQYMNLTAQVQGVDLEKLSTYGDQIKLQLSNMSVQDMFDWTRRQTYLALGNLINVCAALKIDACPMEGFNTNEYNRILKLEEQGLNASVIAPIGYRSVSDHTQHRLKVRKSLEDLFLKL